MLCTLGYQVSGSDTADNATTRRLVALGAMVHRGHTGERVGHGLRGGVERDQAGQPGADGGARAAHPHRAARRDAGRADAFPSRIAIAGTTARHHHLMTASVLAEGGLDPTFVIGGQLLTPA